MPLQRRLPKIGFHSLKSRGSAEVRLHELSKLDVEVIDLAALKAANLIPERTVRAKVILSGKLDKAVSLKGVDVSKGARAAIEGAGGSIS